MGRRLYVHLTDSTYPRIGMAGVQMAVGQWEDSSHVSHNVVDD